MTDIEQLLNQQEGRRLEFKAAVPTNSDLAKTVVAFANDAGGDITSPGLLPPSIDYAAMENRQSDARNKVIARVFKKLGIIDQWGNGLKLVADELRQYPNIELKWKEVGLSFQVQFVNKNYKGEDVPLSSGSDTRQAPDKYPTVTRQAPDKYPTVTPQSPHSYSTVTPQLPHSHPTARKTTGGNTA